MHQIISIPMFFLLILTSRAEDLRFVRKQIEQPMPAGALSMEVEFPFENRSSQPVRAIRFETGCQCLTGVPMSQAIAAGQKGAIQATFTAQPFWNGTVVKSLVVHFDNGQTETLTCHAKLSAAVIVEPWSLSWTVGKPTETKCVSIRFPEGAEAEISKTDLSRAGFTSRIETISKGREYKIHFTSPPSSEPMFVTAKISTTSRFAVAKQFNLFLLLKSSER